MSQQQEITPEQFVINQTIQNLAQENANQAVQIANLTARLQVAEKMAEQSQGDAQPPSPPQEALPGEEPLQPDLEMPDIEH